MIISQFPTGSSGTLPRFTYTGEYSIALDSGGWKIKFLTSGTFTPKSNVDIDIFCVGGGGNGSNYFASGDFDTSSGTQLIRYIYGGGGGAGYTATEKNVSLTADTAYAVTVGTAGNRSAFANLCSANPGINATSSNGGSGGSGGASAGNYYTYPNGVYYGGYKKKSGGNDGSSAGGAGQGTTTREFGESSGALYATGGNAYGSWGSPPNILNNTGDGGHGRSSGSTLGASGIVIIRNAR